GRQHVIGVEHNERVGQKQFCQPLPVGYEQVRRDGLITHSCDGGFYTPKPGATQQTEASTALKTFQQRAELFLLDLLKPGSAFLIAFGFAGLDEGKRVPLASRQQPSRQFLLRRSLGQWSYPLGD